MERIVCSQVQFDFTPCVSRLLANVIPSNDYQVTIKLTVLRSKSMKASSACSFVANSRTVGWGMCGFGAGMLTGGPTATGLGEWSCWSCGFGAWWGSTCSIGASDAALLRITLHQCLSNTKTRHKTCHYLLLFCQFGLLTSFKALCNQKHGKMYCCEYEDVKHILANSPLYSSGISHFDSLVVLWL
jgi:hypothetical protein